MNRHQRRAAQALSPKVEPERNVTIKHWIIRRNADDLTKVVDVSTHGDLGFIHYYYFDGGNMDCDCNRSGYFEDEGQEVEECSDDLYTTVALIDAKGNRYTREDFE
jgi:hypothetical protein